MSRPKQEAVEEHLEALQQLDLKALQAEWRALFGCPAPKGMRSNLLRRAVAYRIQEQAFGGLRAAARRRLRQLAANGGAPTAGAASASARLRPGMRLMREWQGETQVVEVLADGFQWRGDHYGSLSAVANAITGSRWSGVRFFGLHQSKDQSEPWTTEKERGDE
ncbi:MAG: DUF2924 domain-containing protein [Alphaproteobacteria bacterium]